MLADGGEPEPELSGLRADLHPPATFRHEVIGFIRDELPKWRDRADRKSQVAETRLTSQLCAHLNDTSRRAPAWSSLQFRVEEPDETSANRSIDLVAAPTGTAIWIDGMRLSAFDPILPIECKRLPTPSGTDRDEREYLFNQYKSTGGVQRFKAGHHGSMHILCAMIAYVQTDDIPAWYNRVNGWINGLVAANENGWSTNDALALGDHDSASRLAELLSCHSRTDPLGDIEVRHLWIEM